MSFAVIIKPRAVREIERLPKVMQVRIVEGISRIGKDPRGQGTVKLAGAKSTYRLRVGDWRIVYEIDNEAKRVDVTIVAHRREVYR